jgi:hypothetical protein
MAFQRSAATVRYLYEKSILTSGRNFTNLYGTNFIKDSKPKELASAAYGLQTLPIKARAES